MAYNTGKSHRMPLQAKLLTYCLVVASLFLQPSGDLQAKSAAKFDDWVPSEEPCKPCRGYYRDQSYPLLDPNRKPNAPTKITSDSGEFVPDGKSTFVGDVHLIQGNKQLKADKADIFRDDAKKQVERVFATGNVQILEPGIRIDGSTGEYLVATDKRIVQNSKYRIYSKQLRGEADQLTAIGSTKLELKNASYTTCSPHNSIWRVKGTTLKLNKETGRGEIYNGRLFIKRYPILYFPYMNFPIDSRRQTGFLQPTMGYRSEHGMIVTTPWYWNLAPNVDATITPRFMSQRGAEFQEEVRYISDVTNGHYKGAFIAHDKRYEISKPKRLAYHPGKKDDDKRLQALRANGGMRYYFQVKNDTKINKNWSTDLDFNYTNDDNYFTDLDSDIFQSNQTSLLQNITVKNANSFASSSIQFQKYQIIYPFTESVASEAYRYYPRIKIAPRRLNFYNFQYTNPIDITKYAHASKTATIGHRYHMVPTLAYPITHPGWEVKPQVRLDVVKYNVKQPTVSPGRAIPQYSVDSKLIFERDLKLSNNLFTQTLEPRIYYLFVPFKNQDNIPTFDTKAYGASYEQLFRPNSFNGFDRIANANQATLGLSSSFYEFYTGFERLRLNVAQSYYFKKRRFVDPKTAVKHKSNIHGTAEYYLHRGLSANTQVQWTPHKKEIESWSVGTKYNPDDLTVDRKSVV